MLKQKKITALFAIALTLTSCQKGKKEPVKPEIIGEGNIVTGTIVRHKFNGDPAPKIAITDVKEETEKFKSKFNGDYFISKGDSRKIREDYTVGMDIKEGYYLLEVPNQNNGYFRIERDNRQSEKTFNNFFVVNVKRGDYLRVDNVIMSRLQNPYSDVKPKVFEGVHVVGKDIEKAIYQTSEDFKGYLINGTDYIKDDLKIEKLNKNTRYDLSEISRDGSVILVAQGSLENLNYNNSNEENNTDIKTDDNTDKSTENATEQITDAKPQTKPATKAEQPVVEPKEENPTTDKFIIGG